MRHSRYIVVFTFSLLLFASFPYTSIEANDNILIYTSDLQRGSTHHECIPPNTEVLVNFYSGSAGLTLAYQVRIRMDGVLLINGVPMFNWMSRTKENCYAFREKDGNIELLLFERAFTFDTEEDIVKVTFVYFTNTHSL